MKQIKKLKLFENNYSDIHSDLNVSINPDGNLFLMYVMQERGLKRFMEILILNTG